MRMSDRALWPWFAWPAAASFALMLGAMSGGLFFDGRLGWFTLVFAFPTLIGGIAAAMLAASGNTYEAKPKGWRKMRADAEREAYIRDLERELKFR